MQLINSEIKKLNDTQLLERVQELVLRERALGTEILHHLMEVEFRRLYAARGFSSLFEYCVKSLGYSESAAQRRISSMRLMRDMPDIEEKILEGKLSLSVISQAQSFFRQEAKFEKALNLEEKKELLATLENKSAREVERELVSQSSAPQTFYREHSKPVSSNLTELKFLVDAELLQNIEKLKALVSHSNPNMSLAELMGLLVDLGLKKYDPAAKKKLMPTSDAQKKRAEKPAQSVNLAQQESAKRIAVPAHIKQAVWSRDHSQCSFRDPLTKKCCGSKHFLQIDHIQPVSLGGTNDLENLRLLCFEHNQFKARQILGAAKMEAHRGLGQFKKN